MMVSEQKHALPPPDAKGDATAPAAATPLDSLGFASHALAASADPIAAAAAAAAVGLADPNSSLGDAMAFAALPFDESLMSGSSSSHSNSHSSFFIDTAMLAQQIAAVVADEKKLSDVRSAVVVYR